MKPVTVPFFISHQGCPHTCVFCDQRLISGADGALPTAGEIAGKIESWRVTAGERPLEVAFFGGTFTALAESSQEELLTPLQPFLRRGAIASIRISTRPDCLDDSRAAYLAARGVGTIELGVQSMDDAVLAASGRGHTAADSAAAIACIRRHGLQAGAQLMPGLPGDTPLLSLTSLERVIAAGADFVRLYPAIVIRGTELARRYAAGEYLPLDFERGVSLCRVLLHRAMQAGVTVIRIGLQADERLNADTVLAGCWHPALGHIVRSRLYGDLLCRMLAAMPEASCVSVRCHEKRLSDVIGPAKANLQRLRQYGTVDVSADVRLAEEELTLEIDHIHRLEGNIITDLHYSIHEV